MFFNTTVKISHKKLKSFAKKIADHLMPGDWIFLEGDLGTGKTSLTQEISLALGAQNHSTSPTFSLLNIELLSPSPFLHSRGHIIQKILHLDLYRIKFGAELCYLGLENEFDLDSSLCLFEWPYQVEKEEFEEFFKQTGCVKPKRIIEIKIEYGTDDLHRIYSIQNLGNYFI